MITLLVIFLLLSHHAFANEDSNARNLAWVGELRTIPISAFSLVLSPTSNNLSEYEVTQVRSLLQDHILSKYQESNDPIINFALSVELSGIVTYWKPTQMVNNQIKQSHTIVSVEGGVALYPFDIYQRAPTITELHAYTMSVLEQGLASVLRSISGFSLVTSIETLPYQVVVTESPSKAITTSPTKSPTISPTKSPSKQPTLIPTRHPTRRPTKHPTKEPTLSSTHLPTKYPTRHPINDPTQSPQQQQQPAQTPTDSEWVVSNGETMQNLKSRATPWYPIVGAIGGFSIIVGAILVIRRKKKGRSPVIGNIDFSDLDGPHSGSTGKKVAPAYIPSDSEDDVSEFSNVFPIGISPSLAPDSEDRYFDTDSLDEDIDFPQIPFHQDNESFGPAKFL